MTEGQLIFLQHISLLAMRFPCGSEPVCESGVSININVESAAAIAGKPAPTEFCGGHGHRK
jgi:hypothetical protein